QCTFINCSSSRRLGWPGARALSSLAGGLPKYMGLKLSPLDAADQEEHRHKTGSFTVPEPSGTRSPPCPTQDADCQRKGRPSVDLTKIVRFRRGQLHDQPRALVGDHRHAWRLASRYRRDAW